MTSEPLIVQLPPHGVLDDNLQTDPPPSLTSGQVVLDHVPRDTDGRLPPPEAGEIVMSVPSPETLRREAYQIRDVIRDAPDEHEPLVIIVEAAEFLREEELAAVLDAADGAQRPVIIRVLADAD
jgi:hypothetical protein